MNNDCLDFFRRNAGPRAKAAISAVLVTAVIAGCASTPSVEDSQAALMARAKKRWDALIATDLKTAYSLMSPGSRQIVTYEGYILSIRPGFWKAATVKRAECSEATVCEIVIEIQYDYRGMRIATPLRESWAQTDGEWWYVPK